MLNRTSVSFDSSFHKRKHNVDVFKFVVAIPNWVVCGHYAVTADKLRISFSTAGGNDRNYIGESVYIRGGSYRETGIDREEYLDFGKATIVLTKVIKDRIKIGVKFTLNSKGKYEQALLRTEGDRLDDICGRNGCTGIIKGCIQDEPTRKGRYDAWVLRNKDYKLMLYCSTCAWEQT